MIGKSIKKDSEKIMEWIKANMWILDTELNEHELSAVATLGVWGVHWNEIEEVIKKIRK